MNQPVMNFLNQVPTEIMLTILEMLPPDDLLRAIRVSKRWHSMGEVFVYRELWCSTMLGSCRRCLKLLAGRDLDEVHRLRVIHTLLRPQFAAQIRRLTFSDTNSLCTCAKPRIGSASPHAHSFAERFIETVTSLLPSAERLQSLRLHISRSTCSLDAFVRCLQPAHLQLTICRKTYHNGLVRLRHLTLNSSRLHPSSSLPRLEGLCSLDVQIHGADTSPVTARRPLVDLNLFARLKRLHIIGDMWIGIQQQFTGTSDTVETCILQGPMVLGRRSSDFFVRIQSALRYLYCCGTHMISEPETILPQLEFLALHDTIHGAGIFPFAGSPIRAVSLEVGDSYGPYQLEDHNAILQLVLENTRDTLQLLALRSGSMWAPGGVEVSALQSMPLLTALILDGAVEFGRKAWSEIRRLSGLKVITTIDTWTRAPRTRPWAPAPVLSDRGSGKDQQCSDPPAACACGLLGRRSAFSTVDMDNSCFEVYSWLIADPRASYCTHEDISTSTGKFCRSSMLGDKCCA